MITMWRVEGLALARVPEHGINVGFPMPATKMWINTATNLNDCTWAGHIFLHPGYNEWYIVISTFPLPSAIFPASFLTHEQHSMPKTFLSVTYAMSIKRSQILQIFHIIDALILFKIKEKFIFYFYYNINFEEISWIFFKLLSKGRFIICYIKRCLRSS